MSQNMSLTSMLLNIESGIGSGKAGTSTGYLKLPHLPKDENMFGIWKLKVEAIIRGGGLIEVIELPHEQVQEKTLQRLNIYAKEREDKNPDTKTQEHKEIKELTQEQKDMLMNQNYKVYAALADTLNTTDQMRILLNKQNVPDGNAFCLWKAVRERYDIRTTDATKERLWEVFNGIKMNNDEDFKTYKGKVEEAVANLCSVSEYVPDSRIKTKLITGLSTHYSPFVGALYTQDYTSITIADLCKKVNDFEESNVFKSASDSHVDEKHGFASYVNHHRNKFEKKKLWNNSRQTRDSTAQHTQQKKERMLHMS